MDSDFPWILRHVLQGGVQLAFPDHEVDDDESLESDRPCRVANPKVQCPEYLCDSSFARVRRYQDVFDVLGFRGRKLQERPPSALRRPKYMRGA